MNALKYKYFTSKGHKDFNKIITYNVQFYIE